MFAIVKEHGSVVLSSSGLEYVRYCQGTRISCVEFKWFSKDLNTELTLLQGLKGNIVNRALSSFHGRSIEIKVTVPLTLNRRETNSS